jgi:hypothetical protein
MMLKMEGREELRSLLRFLTSINSNAEGKKKQTRTVY